MYLVKRIGYDVYLSAYSEGGALYEHYKSTARELPTPLTKVEWIAEQGSFEGPILSAFEVDDKYSSELASGFSLMSKVDFDKQVAFQDSLAENLSSDDGDSDSLTPAGDVLVSDNFQDGNSKAPFNLQVRNTTGDSVEWVAVVSGTPYLEIPDLVDGDYSHEVSKGDDAYIHTFSGKLDAYQSITITGGIPSPAGTGEGLELFIKEGS